MCCSRRSARRSSWRRINFAEREQYGPAYLAISPKSKVPALQLDDGSVLTEFQAIAVYLGLTNPDKRLIPADARGHARMLEAMDYIVGTIHGLGFARIFRSAAFSPSEADHAAVKARGLEIANNGFALIEQTLAGKDWLAGDFSLADPALFYVDLLGGGAPQDPAAAERARTFRAHDGSPERSEGAEGRGSLTAHAFAGALYFQIAKPIAIVTNPAPMTDSGSAPSRSNHCV